MSTVPVKKTKQGEITIVEKMRDYSNEPAFRKKVEKATAFLQKSGLPETFTLKKKY